MSVKDSAENTLYKYREVFEYQTSKHPIESEKTLTLQVIPATINLIH